MFNPYLLLVLMAVTGLSSSACCVDAADNNYSVSDAYARLIHAQHQLLKSELAVEAKKSDDFESLLAQGHASSLENRQQKLIVDILAAELAAYQPFVSRAMTTLTEAEIKFETKATDSIEMRRAAIQELQQELTSLRQAETKLGRGLATLSASEPWTQGYRLRHAVTSHQADVVAAKIELLQAMNASENDTYKASKTVSATKPRSTSTAAWKRPAADSTTMQLMITQAELQIQLSQHHLSNEIQQLTGLQELATGGMATDQSIVESKEKVDAIKELLQEQQTTLRRLKKELDTSSQASSVYTSVQGRPKKLTVLQSMLNHFEIGQAKYLKREAILKGEMYREVLSDLEHAVAIQKNQSKIGRTSAEFADVLIRGQQRELEQYRWKIKKTELQRDLAEAEIALLTESGGSRPENVNTLVSTRIKSSTPVLLPSRFVSSDPFGLQTTYSAFAFNSPFFGARRSPLATRGALSSSFRPIINRNALSFYLGLQSFRRSSSFGSFNSAFRPLPGFSSFGASPFRRNFQTHSFGRSSQFSKTSVLGNYRY